MSDLPVVVRPLPAPPATDGPGDLHVALDDVARRFVGVQDELRALRRALTSQHAQPLTPRQAAMTRLVDGRPDHGDRDLLALPVEGARVAVVPRLGSAATRDLVAALSDERDLVPTPHPAVGVVVLVRGQPHCAGDDRVLRRAVTIAHQARRADRLARTGISSPVHHPEQVQVAVTDALDALDATDDGQPSVVAEEVWAHIALHRLRRALETSLPLVHPLERLAEYERKRGGDLMGTVGAWLALNGNTNQAAEVLSVHPNTLRYRLRRAEEISGLDLSRSEDRLVAHLTLGFSPAPCA